MIEKEAQNNISFVCFDTKLVEHEESKQYSNEWKVNIYILYLK